MKLAVIIAVFVVGLTVQVSSTAQPAHTSSISVKLQSNGVDAIFWQFVRPFLPNGGIVITTGTTAPTTASTSNTNSNSTQPSVTNVSLGALNESNAIIATGGSSVTANINQTFNPTPETTTATTTTTTANSTSTG